ncbi:ISL3 family transposase [Vagococcus salmoninarum]|uniref:ISL3 family transposase n=2 Tax=Vagococcus salmoninarum TaxID=2739 RepID=UPI00398A959A
MFHNDYIRLSLNLKDPNITFAEKACVEQKIKGVTATLYFATLTYTPTHCKCCDRENTDFLLVKNGFLTSRIKWLHLANRPAYIELKKQRFLCRKCKRTFVAQSEEVAPSCFIANKVKQSLAIELGDAISLKDLSRRHNVSPTTAERILTQLGAAFKVDYTYLPPNLSLDEFKSVKNVVGKMSFIYCNSVTHEIIDILPDRRLNGLKEYFSRFSLEARQQVKTIVVDMNAAYFTLACELFPNAEVIIDRFHVVQLISRSLNQTRIQIMKQFFGSNASKMKDYRKLKNYWRLMLKCSTELDFQTYNYQRLFKKPLPETEIIDYLVSVTQANSEVSNVMLTSLKTLKKHLSRIKNTFQYSYSNGPLEGSINKIKVIKRIAYGYRNFSNFKHRILISFKVTQKSNFTISDEAA